MDLFSALAPDDHFLSEEELAGPLKGLIGKFRDQKVLVLIPDHTRTLPLPFFFKSLVETLKDTKVLDFMVALGTHPPLSDQNMNKLVGITEEERITTYNHIGLLNHHWDDPQALSTIGQLDHDQIRDIAGDVWHLTLPEEIPVQINKAALEYDHLIILGPTFPHEVVGFSGGYKYIFPGISGPEMINATHWLGALAGVRKTIGIRDTPVRKMIHSAAAQLRTPVTLISLVVEKEGVSGLFIGDPISAWKNAADHSAGRHIRKYEKPFQRVLSAPPTMYDELWTAAKAMYKLDPVIADGGEIIVYAPHLTEVSRVHQKYIYEIGYHSLDFFLKQWEKYQHIPLGVLAHSTHFHGDGQYTAGQEQSRVKVILSSQIPKADCKKLNLGYLDPAKIKVEEWKGREDEGVLYVPQAGEVLYRVE